MKNKALKYGLFLLLTCAFIQLVIFTLFQILTKNFDFFSITKFIIFILSIILSSAIITVIVLNTVPYFKNFLIRERSLQRFQNLSHPLLIKLSLQAPGTYHHSLSVANLSYNAAKSIGADAMIVRIGSYYHDIGKINFPQNFIENQKNKHQAQNDDSKNTISKLKTDAKNIIDHVKDGLNFAKQYNIPSEITSFIAEHHGTTQTLYFFNKAKQLNPKIDINIFTYPGPKPLSKETAIVMLADAIEAKLRLVKDINTLDIKETVDEIIHERYMGKQLDLSGIDKQDLDKINLSFKKTLSTIHHQRINYKND